MKKKSLKKLNDYINHLGVIKMDKKVLLSITLFIMCFIFVYGITDMSGYAINPLENKPSSEFTTSAEETPGTLPVLSCENYIEENITLNESYSTLAL